MHIGIDARSLTEAHPSGVSVYTYSLLRELFQLHNEHTYTIFTSGFHNPSNAFIADLLTHDNVAHVHHGWPNKLFHASALLTGHPQIDSIVKNIDVLFAPNIHVMPVSTVVPLVLTVDDMSFAMYPQFLSSRRKVWHTVVRPSNVMKRAQHIIAVSETTKADIIRIHPECAEKITTIHSAVPITPQRSVQPQDLLNLPEQYILALSTVEPRKNIEALVQAFLKYTDRNPSSALHLVVAGSPGWKSQRTISVMQNHPRITYVGYITEEQKAVLLERATAFIYPSIYEGFGFPPLEALRSGLPVIASRAGALPEVLGNAAYYIDPYSIEDMITAFDAVTNDAVLIAHLQKAADTTVSRYNWHTTATATLKVLEQAI